MAYLVGIEATGASNTTAKLYYKNWYVRLGAIFIPH